MSGPFSQVKRIDGGYARHWKPGGSVTGIVGRQPPGRGRARRRSSGAASSGESFVVSRSISGFSGVS